MYKKLATKNQEKLFILVLKDENERIKIEKIKLSVNGAYYFFKTIHQDAEKYHEELIPKIRRRKFDKKGLVLDYLIDSDLKEKYLK